jgi:hypothetical protein
MDRYTTLAAEQWLAEGRTTNGFELFFHPRFAFIRNYLLRGGFTDGTPGLLVSTLNSYYVFLKLAKLWELQHGPGTRVPGPVNRQPPLAAPDVRGPKSAIDER